MVFDKDLKRLGLSEKEAAVYLATLGLGPSTVQTISRKSKVARATTYLVLDSLLEMGLVAKFEEGDSTTFVAESPEQLGQLLNRQEQSVQERRDLLQDLLPKLRAFTREQDDRPIVRYFEGVDGLKAIRAETLRRSVVGERWCQFTPVDYMLQAFGGKDFYEEASYATQRKGKRIQSRSIVITESEELKSRLRQDVDSKWVQRKFLDASRFTSSSGFAVTRDWVVVVLFGKKVGGVVIESQSVALMMQTIFDWMWGSLADS